MGEFDQFGTRLAENLGLTNPLDALRQGHPVPAYQVLVDGKDISAAIRPRLMSMTITDNRGFTADTIELTLDDSDGQLDMPRRGATLRALIGWQGQALVDKGTYKILAGRWSSMVVEPVPVLMPAALKPRAETT